MPRITKITYKEDKDRCWVYINNEYCASIRKRTFDAMNLQVGSEITCSQLKDKENFFWKSQYANKWEEEKVRLNRVKDLINYYTNQIEIETTGFGADSNEFIAEHPEEHGEPDLTLKSKTTGDVKMLLEVTGTKFMRGTDYWVRPDKLDYAINNPQKNVWIALHFEQPNEKFIFIKPDLNKTYNFETENINNAGERYVKFNDDSNEVFTMKQFVNIITNDDFDC